MSNPKHEALVQMRPVGLVRRLFPHENDRDRSLVCQIVLDADLDPALDGIDEWSHLYVIFWMDQVSPPHQRPLHHPNSDLGVFAARSPIHPNPIGLTLVELIKREGNVLWVRGLDALDGTPVLDIKPYPDWEKQLLVVSDFCVPAWLEKIVAAGAEKPSSEGNF